MLFESQTPGAVEVVVGVGAECHHCLGAGCAGEQGYFFGDDFGEAFEVWNSDHDDEVVGARDRVGLGDAIYGEHGLGGLLDALALGPDEDYSRYHAGSLGLSPTTRTIKVLPHIAFRPSVPFPEMS